MNRNRKLKIDGNESDDDKTGQKQYELPIERINILFGNIAYKRGIINQTTYNNYRKLIIEKNIQKQAK